MDDENENLVGIDDVYSDDFQTQVLVSRRVFWPNSMQRASARTNESP